jgi:hypothetical protein
LQLAQGFRLRLPVAAVAFSWLQPTPQSRLAATQGHCVVAHALLQVQAPALPLLTGARFAFGGGSNPGLYAGPT